MNGSELVTDYEQWETLLLSQVDKFVEASLHESIVFGNIVRYVQSSSRDHSIEHIGPIVSDLDERWRIAIERLRDDVERHFAAQDASFSRQHVLKKVLMQLMLYYQRFVDVLSPLELQLPKPLVSVKTLMYEVKKHVS